MVDVKLYFGTSPPCMVPMSSRAKEYLDLPEGVEGILLTDCPSKAIAVFPPDYVFEETKQSPKIVAITGISRLH